VARANVGYIINEAERVFINENLTALRLKLFRKVRNKKEDLENWKTLVDKFI